MSLKKITEIEGDSFIKSQVGIVNNGVQKVTFSAVCKVNFINGGKEELSVNVLHIGDGIKYERTYSFVPSVAEGAPNFIKQAYLHLKTLPEFSSAEDC